MAGGLGSFGRNLSALSAAAQAFRYLFRSFSTWGPLLSPALHYAPRAEAPPALDAGSGRVNVLEGDAVEAGAEVLVEAGHAQLRRHQLLRGNGPKERKMLDVAIICFERKSSFRETSHTAPEEDAGLI